MGTRICEKCGVLLTSTPIKTHGTFQLETEDNKTICNLPTPGDDGGYIIGRSDDPGSYKPDIDLSPYNAHEEGVSRRHAALVSYRDIVQIIDLKSANGTFLNNERLQPEIPYQLNHGDTIKFGNLAIHISHTEH